VRAHHLVGDLVDFRITAAHHGQVVLHHARALGAELGLQLLFNGAEQRFFGQARVGAHRRRVEERALEGVALHAQLQFGAAGFVACDLECVEVINADLLLHDLLARPQRERWPRWLHPGCSG
jgi:hypothetical protein